MKKYYVFFFVSIISLLSYSISEVALKNFQKANELFLASRYEEALSIYTKIQQELKGVKLESIDKSIKEITDEAVLSIELITKLKNILPLVKQAKELETYKIEDSISKYIEIKKICKSEQITKIPYIEYVIEGTLEEYMKDRISKKIENLNPDFLDKVNKDKKRKKNLGFYTFKKDPRIEFDFQKIMIDNLLNLLERKKVINIDEKILTGQLERALEEAKEKNIDFLLTGEYKQLSEEIISFNLYIIDPFLNKKIIEANIVMPLTREFFYSLDQIIAIVEKNLVSYSRLEEFKTLTLTKRGEGRIIQSVKEDLREDDLPAYIDNKLFNLVDTFINNQIPSRKEENKDILEKFNEISNFVENFNNLEDTKKIQNPILKEENKKILKEVMKEEIKPEIVKMNISKENNEYDDYYKYYNNARDKLDEIENKYKHLTLIVKEIKNEMDKEKTEIDVIISNIKKITTNKLGVILAVGGYELKNKEYSSSIFNMDRHSFLKIGIEYENRIFKDVWGVYGITFNINQLNGQFYVTNINKKYSVPSLSLNLGLKFYTLFDLFITNSAEFSFPLSKRKEMNIATPLVMFKVGLGYDIIENLNIGFNLGYYSSGPKYMFEYMNTIHTIKYEGEFYTKSFEIFTTYYFWSEQKFDLTKKYNKKIWISPIAGYSFIRVDDLPIPTLDKSEIYYESPIGGVGISYYIDKNISFGLDLLYSYFTSSKTWEKDTYYYSLNSNIRSLDIILNSTITLFKLYGIGLILSPKIGTKIFVEKSILYLVHTSSSISDVGGSVSRYYLYINPLSFGFSFDISDNIKLYLIGGKPILIPLDIEQNGEFLVKLEFNL